MSGILGALSAIFTAGAFGGLINALAVWASGHFGVSSALGVSIAPDLAPAMIYSKAFWGGLWGVLFLLPWWRGGIFKRGFFYSLGPTLVQLLVVFPFKAQKGFLGLDLGLLTPVMVLAFNAAWGWAAAIWLRLMHK